MNVERLILLLAEGHTWDEACDWVPCSRGFAATWTRRFGEQRLAGLYSRHLGQSATVLTPELEARILEATRRRPTDGTTHWSTRRLGEHLGVSYMMVARVWSKHGLRPQRMERYMASNDPDFERKAADIIGLYLNPPAHGFPQAASNGRQFAKARGRPAPARRAAASRAAAPRTKTGAPRS